MAATQIIVYVKVAGTGGAAGPIEPRITDCANYLADLSLPVPNYADRCD
jgi:hypothetical protein